MIELNCGKYLQEFIYGVCVHVHVCVRACVCMCACVLLVIQLTCSIYLQKFISIGCVYAIIVGNYTPQSSVPDN